MSCLIKKKKKGNLIKMLTLKHKTLKISLGQVKQNERFIKIKYDLMFYINY